MREKAPVPPAGWEMQVLEVVPRLFIGTKIVPPAEYATLSVDAIVDLEPWDCGLSMDGFEALSNESFVAWLLGEPRAPGV
jgi:hypothetical protein